MSSTLTALVADLAAGRLRVIDLSQPLGPTTPVIDLPPLFAASPGVSIDTISRYDDRGPAWYWNTLRFGEHTGTHFDAPVHWITGKDLPDNTCDTIPAARFVGPVLGRWCDPRDGWQRTCPSAGGPGRRRRWWRSGARSGSGASTPP